MICGSLGSILSKLCDSFSCVFGTLCNCSKNYVLVIQDENDRVVRDIITISSQNLAFTDALQQWSAQHPDPKDVESVKIKSELKSLRKKDQSTKGKAAILSIARQSLAKISEGTMNHKEQMARMTAAASLAGIQSLADVYNKSNFMNAQKFKAIQKQVSYIQEYGSSAAFLWGYLKSAACRSADDLKFLKEKNVILDEQIPVLLKIFENQQRESPFRRDTFSEVDIRIQSVFLQAAEFFPSQSIERQTFIPWTEELNTAFHISGSSEQTSSTQPELIGLIQDLNVTNKPLNNSLNANDECYLVGVKRTELICSVIGLKINSIYQLKSDQIKAIKKHIPKLQRLDATMFHIFISLKKTIDPEVLKSRYRFTDDIISYIKDNKNHLTHITLKENILELDIDALSFLYNIAILFDSQIAAEFSKQYSLNCWLDTGLYQPSSSYTRLKTNRSELKLSFTVDEIESANKSMNKQRERSLHEEQKNSPERKVAK